jgi:hypothetical protein
VPVLRTAAKADPLIKVRAVLQGELIHLRALVDCSSLNLTIALFIVCVRTMVVA